MLVSIVHFRTKGAIFNRFIKSDDQVQEKPKKKVRITKWVLLHQTASKKLALHTNEDTKIKNKMATPFHEEIDYIRMYSATFGSKYQYILVIKFLLNIVSSREIVINRFYPPEHQFLASSTVRCCMSVRTPALQRGHRTS